MDAVAQLLLTGGGVSLFLILAIIIYVLVTKKVDKALERFGTRFDDLKEKVESLTTQKEKLDFVIENFDVLENAILSMMDNKEISHFIDFEIDRLRESFNTNFSNGSHKEKAYNDIQSFQKTCLDHISNSNSPFKIQTTWLLDVLVQALFELVESLLLITDYSMKQRLIVTFLDSMSKLLDYFKIFSRTPVFTSLGEDQVKSDLRNKFKNFGTRKPYAGTTFKKVV